MKYREYICEVKVTGLLVGDCEVEEVFRLTQVNTSREAPSTACLELRDKSKEVIIPVDLLDLCFSKL